MGIHRIKVELCAGGEIPEVMRQMIDMAERYKCEVTAELNGTEMTVGPDRVADIFELWNLRRERAKSGAG